MAQRSHDPLNIQAHQSVPPPRPQRPIVLVGKGVCFDTGGINLKPANPMKTMKHDMAGSSAALGAFAALAQTGFPYPVEVRVMGETVFPHRVLWVKRVSPTWWGCMLWVKRARTEVPRSR